MNDNPKDSVEAVKLLSEAIKNLAETLKIIVELIFKICSALWSGLRVVNKGITWLWPHIKLCLTSRKTPKQVSFAKNSSKFLLGTHAGLLAFMVLFFALSTQLMILHVIQLLCLTGDCTRTLSPKIILVVLAALFMGYGLSWHLLQIKLYRTTMNREWLRMSVLQKVQNVVTFVSLYSVTFAMTGMP
jgi:hypothetical protein